ncbi:4-coumarate--CoA ligase 2-like protein [Drosera capensis]
MSTTANPMCTPIVIEKQARASQAKVIVTQAAFVEKVRKYADESEVKIVVIGEPVPEGGIHFSILACADENELPDVEVQPDDVVALHICQPLQLDTNYCIPIMHNHEMFRWIPSLAGFSVAGVMLTHKGLLTSGAQQVDGENPNLYLHSEDVLLCVLPLFHIYSTPCRCVGCVLVPQS